MAATRQIAIIGAGITGLTAALSLHRAGARVTVYESVPVIEPLGVGINLLPHSVQALAGLGLRERLERHAVLTSHLRYHAKNGRTIWSEPRGVAAGYTVPQYSIHRGDLQMVLLAAVHAELGPRAVVTGHCLTAVEQDGDRVRAHFRDPATAADLPAREADLLIGADGLHSAVRAQLNPDEGNPVYAGQVLWRGVTRRPPFADGRTMVMIGNDDLKAVIYPIRTHAPDDQLVNWIAERRIDKSLPANRADWNRPGDRADFLPWFESWRFDWLDVPALFSGPGPCWEFPMADRDPLSRWTVGRITLMGDAAHVMRPNGSNGASQGILDAICLAEQLREYADPLEALESYEAIRRPLTTALTLANRRTGPEIVLRMVEERCPDGFEDIHDHFSIAELEAIANSYKQIAGFTVEQVARTGLRESGIR
jgi:2-polyprenyl-6-methoxyphenol hydroxylase-like FAD-dependent oxidoreductase